MIIYFILALIIAGLVGTTISFVLLTIIVCCIIVVFLIKNVNRQNVRVSNSNAVELQTIRSENNISPSLNSTQPSAPPRPYEIPVLNNQGKQPNEGSTVEVGILMAPPPPCYSDIFNN